MPQIFSCKKPFLPNSSYRKYNRVESFLIIICTYVERPGTRTHVMIFFPTLFAEPFLQTVAAHETFFHVVSAISDAASAPFRRFR